MAAFFGIDELKAQVFIDNRVICISGMPTVKMDLHAVVSPIKNADIVFI